MAEAKQGKSESKVIKLSPNQCIDMIAKRYLAYIGWDGKKVGGKKRLITRPLVLTGPKGIGKSEIPAQAAKKIQEIIGGAIGKQHMTTRGCNLQFLECPDLAGLPYVEKVDGETLTMHGRPVLLPSAGFGLWFLDEPNRSGRDIRSALLTLIQDRRVNDYTLGENWMIIMAMNPPEAFGTTYEVGEWDAALQDRVSPVWFEGSVTELVDHLTSIYGNHPVIKWIASGGMDAVANKVADFRGHGRNSPRGLEFMIRAIEGVGGVDSPDAFRAAAIEVGEDLATVFMTFLRAIRNITAEEILDAYDNTVAEKVSAFEQEGRHDALNSLVEGVASLLAKRFESGALKPGSKEFNEVMTRVCKFLDEAPADQKTGFFLVAGERINSVLQDKAIFLRMCEFIKENAPVLIKHLQVVKTVRAQSNTEADTASTKK